MVLLISLSIYPKQKWKLTKQHKWMKKQFKVTSYEEYNNPFLKIRLKACVIIKLFYLIITCKNK